MSSRNHTASNSDLPLNVSASAARKRPPAAFPIRCGAQITASAVLTFSLVQIISVPLHGLWAVLTAVIVSQASIDGSFRASLEYVLGTLAGAAYASAVTLLIPHSTPLAMGIVLTLTIAPLAYAAARSKIFQVAPFTAIIVLLVARQFGQGPIAAAITRVVEVALGGAVAVLVSLFVFPEPARRNALTDTKSA